MNHSVLLVDDDPHILEGLKRVLRKEPYDLLTAASAEDAAGVLDRYSVDLIVTDEQMPGMSGSELLARVHARQPDIVGIVLTGQPTLAAALRAINQGNVYQFFTKPCNEIDLALAIRRALEQKELTEKSRALLSVTRRQSALIEEARVLRRMRGVAGAEHRDVAAVPDSPTNTRDLLADIQAELDRGHALLSDAPECSENTARRH